MSGPSLHNRGFALILMAVFISVPVPAQDNQQVPYTQEEYNAYQNAVNTEPAKREDAILAFIKANPKSSLVQYAVTSYLQLLQEYQNQGQPQKVLPAAEKLMPLAPNDSNTMAFAAIAAYQLGQWAKATEYGEKVVSEKPGLGFILASSYAQLKNDQKVLQYGEKACADLPAKDCFQILPELTRIYAARSSWNRAAEYANKTLEAFEAVQKPPQASQADWNKYVAGQRALAHGVLGRQAVERENWTAAEQHYRRVLSLNVSPESRAEAYYFTGTAAWKRGNIDAAMQDFAKGSVQRGAPNARPCRQQLEKLYRATHNDSLAGIEDFINQHTR